MAAKIVLFVPLKNTLDDNTFVEIIGHLAKFLFFDAEVLRRHVFRGSIVSGISGSGFGNDGQNFQQIIPWNFLPILGGISVGNSYFLKGGTVGEGTLFNIANTREADSF